MKKSIILATILFVSSNMMAEDNYYVGIEIGKGDLSVKASDNSNSLKVSTDGGYQALKFGKYIGQGRVYLAFNNFNEDPGVDISAFTGAYDYIFSTSTEVKPFLGGFVTNFSYTETVDTDSVKLSGLQFGLNLGLGYDIGKNHNIELGYRKTLVSNGDTTYNNIKFEIDSFSQFYLGYNYKF